MFAQMNFGAALRSAFFLGAAGVLSCARNSSPLSPVVSKASAGAALWTHCCVPAPACVAECCRRHLCSVVLFA